MVGQAKVHAFWRERCGKSTADESAGRQAQAPTVGQILLNGEVRSLHTPKQAKASGIVLIPQEQSLAFRTVGCENIFLGSLPEEVTQTGVDCGTSLAFERVRKSSIPP